jgi:beta-galactosidase GanA
MAVDESGGRVQFGNRCHYCVNSPEFHAATRRIVSAMAERFGNNPHVIGATGAKPTRRGNRFQFLSARITRG